jgi:hypothetical protein
MIDVDMESVPAFTDAVNSAARNGELRGVARSLARYLNARGVNHPDIHKHLCELPLGTLRQLRDECFNTDDREELGETRVGDFGLSGTPKNRYPG